MARVRKLLIITLVCLTWGCAQAGDSTDGAIAAEHRENAQAQNLGSDSPRLTQHALTKAWNSGAAAVIAIDAAPDESDETYGDFAYYLNQFRNDVEASTEPHWVFFTHPPLDVDAGNDSLPLEIRVSVQPYSVLFIHKGHNNKEHGEGYLYQGPILEPQVYQFIEHLFSGRSMPPHLHQFSPEPVTVQQDPDTGNLLIQ